MLCYVHSKYTDYGDTRISWGKLIETHWYIETRNALERRLVMSIKEVIYSQRLMVIMDMAE